MADLSNGRRWLLIADASEARLNLCNMTAAKQWHAEQVDRIGNDGPPEHRRPPTVLPVTSLGGSGLAEMVSQQRRRWFLRALVDWVTSEAQKFKIDRLEVFAPVPFLAELRELWPQEMAGRLHEHGRDLKHFQAWQIAELPAVRRVLEPAAT